MNATVWCHDNKMSTNLSDVGMLVDISVLCQGDSGLHKYKGDKKQEWHIFVSL